MSLRRAGWQQGNHRIVLSGRWSHAPAGYRCPFCDVATGRASPPTWSRESDVVLRSPQVVTFVAARWWPDNPGHALVIPAAHVENVYDLGDELAVPLLRAVRAVARAMKTAYGCDGVTIRQNNEPAGGQDVWHHHQHVVPRWAGDWYRSLSLGYVRDPAERAIYADRLRQAIDPALDTTVG